MTWTPPPESERPDGYKCLALVEIYEGRSIWAEVVWQTDDVDEPYWFIPILDCDLEESALFAPLPEVTTARIEALARRAAEAEARARRYKSERNGLERRVTDVQRQTTASEEAERRIVNQREEIKRLQEIVSHYMRMLPTGEAALDAIAVIEEQPEPARYVWVVEQDDCIQDTTESLEEALKTMDWLKECGMLTPITITRFVEAPE